MPSAPYFRKGHTFGSLQHAPQRTHLPLRLVETDKIEVKVRFILVRQVFRDASAISKYQPTRNITYAQLRQNSTTARIQAIARSICVRYTRIVRPKTKRTTIAMNNTANTEKRRGLYNHAWPTWPCNRHNAPRVNPQVGQAIPVPHLNGQVWIDAPLRAVSQMIVAPSPIHSDSTNSAHSGQPGRRELRTSSIFIAPAGLIGAWWQYCHLI